MEGKTKMSIRHESVTLQFSTGPKQVYLLQGAFVPYLGVIYGVFESWELLMEHANGGYSSGIAVISEYLLSTADCETGRMHAALLECRYTIPNVL
jgi:hypothetical protein